MFWAIAVSITENEITPMYTSATIKWKGEKVTISRKEDGSVHISPRELFASVKSGLREIAKDRGIFIDESWNTRYLGLRVLKSLMGVDVANRKDKQIEREMMLASSFLETDDNDNVKITLENVAKVEAMISYDSKYSRSGDPLSEPDENWLAQLKGNFRPMSDYKGYRGSSAFWMKRLRDYFYRPEADESFKEIKGLDYYKFLVYNAVCAVDAENSTHINADSVGREQLTGRIVSLGKDFLTQLKDTKDYPLIKLLSHQTKPNGKTYKLKTGEVKEISPRENFSFATKFCHYACFFIFEEYDTEYRDSYSIYDYVVSNALKEHYDFIDMDRKGVEMSDNFYVEKYRNYQRKVDEIRGDIVSRNGFDHLIWYYYKGRGK